MGEAMMETLINLGFNGGAFGVLVVIAVYLMKNIPKWIDAHLTTMKQISETHRQEAKDAQDVFSKEITAEREQCQRHNDRMVQLIENSNAATLKAFETVGQRISDHHNYAVQQLADMQRRRD